MKYTKKKTLSKKEAARERAMFLNSVRQHQAKEKRKSLPVTRSALPPSVAELDKDYKLNDDNGHIFVAKKWRD